MLSLGCHPASRANTSSHVAPDNIAPEFTWEVYPLHRDKDNNLISAFFALAETHLKKS